MPGAVAFVLHEPVQPPTIPDLFGREWGHIHPAYDGSLHVNVPTALAEQLIERGWAEFHHVVDWGLVPPYVIMLYGPRDDAELAVARAVVEAAYVAAGGARSDATGGTLGQPSIEEVPPA